MASTFKHRSKDDPTDPSVALFQRDWQIYRKMVDHNFLFHREAYARLRQVLVERFDRPFSFLDIACGDASASVEALRGTKVAHYHGIDLSQAALELAEAAVATLGCPCTLERDDFASALDRRTEPVDVAWIGLSLHHFQTDGKLEVMRRVRRIVSAGGLFLIFENAGPDGETREAWLRRFDHETRLWTAYTPDELRAMQAHVHAADLPETDSGWRWLGRQAGFDTVTELYATPTDLFRLYSFA